MPLSKKGQWVIQGVHRTRQAAINATQRYKKWGATRVKTARVRKVGGGYQTTQKSGRGVSWGSFVWSPRAR